PLAVVVIPAQMTTLARVRGLVHHPTSRRAAPNVLDPRDCLKVDGVDAATLAAQVVEGHAPRDRATQCLVHHAMRVQPSPSGRVVLHDPVAMLMSRPDPEPAAGDRLRLDLAIYDREAGHRRHPVTPVGTFGSRESLRGTRAALSSAIVSG